MAFQSFCEKFVYLQKKPLAFTGRGYLRNVYAATDRNLILRCSRQVEKSTMLCNRIIYEAIANPGISLIFVCPRQEQASVFSKSRLIPMIEGSPCIRRVLLGDRGRRPQVMNMRFKNDSQVYIRAAYHSADPVRGLSGDLLFVDEFQDIANRTLPVLQETLSHSSQGRVILTATPKGQDNHVESIFQQSTGCEWRIVCRPCRRSAVADERILGTTGLHCPLCRRPISAAEGGWVARNPQSVWGHGYWINHLMVPWLNYEDILMRQATYDAARFKNECLGLPTELGDHVITRAEVEACCTDRKMAMTLAEVPREGKRHLIAGIDWGGGVDSCTVVTIGYIRADKKFVVVRIAELRAQEDPQSVLDAVARLCTEFKVRVIGADGGGNGSVYNRLLLDKLGAGIPLFAILYSQSSSEPSEEGALLKWTVDRTVTLGGLFSRLKKQMTLFPQVEQCGHFLEQFTNEIAEFDEHNRTIRYVCPENQRNDALHSLNYAQQPALRLWHRIHPPDE